jgi:hypothetical protein
MLKAFRFCKRRGGLVALSLRSGGALIPTLCFYIHPTLSVWFTSEWSDWGGATWTEKPRGSGERVGRRANQYQKSGKKLDMGKRLRPLQKVGGLGSRRGRPHRCARVRGGTHGQLPRGEGSPGQGKEGETKEVTLATAFSKKSFAACARQPRTGDARGVADEEARSRKARKGICGEVINAPCDSLRYRS